MPFRVSSTDAGGLISRHNHCDQPPSDTADWEAVTAALGELGFHVQAGRTPAADDVVLAAQLRLRYWRRQLPCGRLASTSGDTMCCHSTGMGVSRSEAPKQLGDQHCDIQPVTTLEQQSRSESLVRHRIRSIKSARDYLLAWNRRSVLAAIDSQ